MEFDVVQTRWTIPNVAFDFLRGDIRSGRVLDVVASLVVTFRDEGTVPSGTPTNGPSARMGKPIPVAVNLVMAEGTTGRITEADLRRFAWTRWLQIAGEVARNGVLDVEVSRRKVRTIRDEKGLRNVTARPGRRGHSDDWWDRVVALHQALKLDPAVKAPNTQLAKEYGVSPATVSGWVKHPKYLAALERARTIPSASHA